MDRQTAYVLRFLARGLFWAGAVLLLMGVIGATEAFTSDATLVGLPELESEGRTAGAIFALGSGITAAGVLAGLGAIILALVPDPDLEDGE